MNLSTCQILKKMQITYNGNAIRLEGDLLRRFQLELLKIAEDVIGVCEEENIPYILAGGTALGAVRHNGFIPWDDDMDICILSKDIEQFIKKFSEKYPKKYMLLIPNNKNATKSTIQVRLNGSIYNGISDIEAENEGFGIDIFKLENVPDNKVLRLLHGNLCLLVGLILSCQHYYVDRRRIKEFIQDNREAQKVFAVKFAIGLITSFFSLETWAKITDWCHGLCKNNNSHYINGPAGRKHYFGNMYLRADIFPSVRLPFEGHMWCVAQNYDAYLRTDYGDDYMCIPAEESREKHLAFKLKFPDEEFATSDLY